MKIILSANYQKDGRNAIIIFIICFEIYTLFI